MREHLTGTNPGRITLYTDTNQIFVFTGNIDIADGQPSLTGWIDFVAPEDLPYSFYDGLNGIIFRILPTTNRFYFMQANSTKWEIDVTFTGAKLEALLGDPITYHKIDKNYIPIEAGNNVSITEATDSLVISATDTTYNAGSGIDITGSTISVKVDGTTIDVNSNGELEAIGGGGSSYTFTNGLSESGGTVSWDFNSALTKQTSGQYFSQYGVIYSGETGNKTIENLGVGFQVGIPVYPGFGNFSQGKKIQNFNRGTGNLVGGNDCILSDTGDTLSGILMHGYGLTSGGYLPSGAAIIGRYNVAPSSGDNKLLTIGNGTSNAARSNAFTVDTSGNVYATGNVTANNIPAAPSVDGEYDLHCSVSSGTVTYSWVART
jgi:hypothetical protein